MIEFDFSKIVPKSIFDLTLEKVYDEILCIQDFFIDGILIAKKDSWYKFEVNSNATGYHLVEKNIVIDFAQLDKYFSAFTLDELKSDIEKLTAGYTFKDLVSAWEASKSQTWESFDAWFLEFSKEFLKKFEKVNLVEILKNDSKID